MPKKSASKSKSASRENKGTKKVVHVKKTIKKTSKSVTPQSVKAFPASTTHVKDLAPAKTDAKKVKRTHTMKSVVKVIIQFII